MNILLVYKKSVYELYKDSPDAEVRAYAAEPENLQKLLDSHNEQQRTLETIAADLNWLGMTHKELYRAELQNLSPKDFAGYDLILSVGGDGTFLEVSHYIHNSNVPLLGVNSDPHRSVGYFCSAHRNNFRFLMKGLKREPTTTLNRLQLIRDGIPLPELVLNDILFAHANPAANTRFTLEVAKKGRNGIAEREKKATEKETEEEKWKEPQHYHGSNGLLVCTAAGSTAWMYNLGGEVMGLGSQQMQYKVRDAHGEKPHFTEELRITSQTREGKIWVDGAHLNYELGLGGVLEIKPGTPLTVIGDLQVKRKEWERKEKEKKL